MIDMAYKLLIVCEGKYFGVSTPCLYVNVGGENGESGVLEIPRGEFQLEFTVSEIEEGGGAWGEDALRAWSF